MAPKSHKRKSSQATQHTVVEAAPKKPFKRNSPVPTPSTENTFHQRNAHRRTHSEPPENTFDDLPEEPKFFSFSEANEASRAAPLASPKKLDDIEVRSSFLAGAEGPLSIKPKPSLPSVFEIDGRAVDEHRFDELEVHRETSNPLIPYTYSNMNPSTSLNTIHGTLTPSPELPPTQEWNPGFDATTTDLEDGAVEYDTLPHDVIVKSTGRCAPGAFSFSSEDKPDASALPSWSSPAPGVSQPSKILNQSFSRTPPTVGENNSHGSSNSVKTIAHVAESKHRQGFGFNYDDYSDSEEEQGKSVFVPDGNPKNVIINVDTSFDEILVTREPGSFHIDRPQKVLPCTEATREDTIVMKKKAEDLMLYVESPSMYSQLITRVERMTLAEIELYEGKQRAIIPSITACAVQLRNFLLNIKEGRVATGESRTLVQHEIEWVNWIIDATSCGVVHLKTKHCGCKPDWADWADIENGEEDEVQEQVREEGDRKDGHGFNTMKGLLSRFLN